jgi:hypothetical protein
MRAPKASAIDAARHKQEKKAQERSRFLKKATQKLF